MSTIFQYRRIKVAPKNEERMLDVLMNDGETFKAISKDEYYITNKQCTLLTRKKIPYQKIPYQK